MADEGINASVGTTSDSYDNALTETIIGLFKTEVILSRGPWRGLDTVKYATLGWVDWFNNRRLLEPIGNVPPAEEKGRIIVNCRSRLKLPDSNKPVSRITSAVQL